MDGNKKIIKIVYAAIVALSMAACTVKPPGYVSLYLDNSRSVNDTVKSLEMQASLSDNKVPYIFDATNNFEPELPVLMRVAEEKSKVSLDSVYHHEITELIEAISDSIQILQLQMIELHQHAIEPDTIWDIVRKIQPDSIQSGYKLKQPLQPKNDTIDMLSKQISELQKSGSIESDTLFKEKTKQFSSDSLHTSDKTDKLLQAEKDTADAVNEDLFEMQDAGYLKTDTGYVNKKTTISPAGESQQLDHLTHQLIRAKDEQIKMMQNQLNALQNEGGRIPQQTHIIRGSEQVKPLGSQQPDYSTRQLLKSMDEQIRILQNQLNLIETTAGLTRQTSITKEPDQAQSLASHQLQAKNDSIQILRSQINDLQLRTTEIDTVFKEKGPQITQAVNKLEVDYKTSELFQGLQDTLLLLKALILSMEEQILKDNNTQTREKRDEIDVIYETKTDTILLNAYYDLGEINPIEEESILQQIEELFGEKTVTKVTLSGYTDSSGSEAINKKITTLRLNYLSDLFIPWIPKEKVFFQNFGDAFASDMVISNERRIEIRIHIK